MATVESEIPVRHVIVSPGVLDEAIQMVVSMANQREKLDVETNDSRSARLGE